MRKITAVAGAALALAGCATPVTDTPQASQAALGRERERQQELLLERIVAEQERVFTVAWPLLVANTELCGDTVAQAAGFQIWTKDSITSELRDAGDNLYGLSAGPTIMFVAPESPAANAGLQRGDRLLSVGGTDVSGRRSDDLSHAFETALARSMRYDLRLDRKGTEFQVTLWPRRICNYPVTVDPEDENINAFSNGEEIVVAHAMMRFIESDDELALVLGHELGHNVMEHNDKGNQNATVGAIGGLLIDVLFAAGGVNTGGAFMEEGMRAGADAYSVDFEREADYVGLYFAARAGFDISGSADFWRRFAVEDPAAITHQSTHPTTPDRSLALEATEVEILNKARLGQSLVPDLRPEG